MKTQKQEAFAEAKDEYDRQHAAWRDSAPGERVGALLVLQDMIAPLQKLAQEARAEREEGGA